MNSETKISSLDDAIGKAVICTDGETRFLHSYDERLGYYSVPITNDGVWMRLDGTYLRSCREIFIGGTLTNYPPAPNHIIG